MNKKFFFENCLGPEAEINYINFDKILINTNEQKWSGISILFEWSDRHKRERSKKKEMNIYL